MIGWRAIVFGQVQRVGFRAYVRDLADRYGVVGAVWNRTDGAVELEAAHSDPAMLAAFLQALQDGPGRVDRVDRFPQVVAADEFRIGATRPPT